MTQEISVMTEDSGVNAEEWARVIAEWEQLLPIDRLAWIEQVLDQPLLGPPTDSHPHHHALTSLRLRQRRRHDRLESEIMAEGENPGRWARRPFEELPFLLQEALASLPHN